MNAESSNQRRGTRVLDIFIDTLTLAEALDKAGHWAARPVSRYVCFCNVHSLVTASVRPDLANTLGRADLVLPDGTPVAWALRALGFSRQKRISGPDFMWEYCALAQSRQVSVFLYGNRPATLDKLQQALREAFPALRIAGAHSPPFRPLTQAEDDAVVEEIRQSGADIVFVSLGCPKQELWMAGHRDRIDAVMLGVGAAFDYHAGLVHRPSPWVRNIGLEWLWRLAQDPKRLWKRYMIANSIFVCRAARQVIDHIQQRDASRAGVLSVDEETAKEATPDHV